MRFAVVAVIGICGCYMSYAEYADERDGVDVDAATDAEADARDDAGRDARAEADAGGGLVPCAGGRLDPTSGLCWQDPPADAFRDWDRADAYCRSLGAVWRLPTIAELRSLIRACPPTDTGGACAVTNPTCLGFGCLNSECAGCPDLGGPGTEGCYWPPGMSGSCTSYWSSSRTVDGPYAWYVLFRNAYVFHSDETNPLHVRCVRAGR